MKYLSVQIKQFLLSTAFVLVAVIGVTISNSFNQEYLAEMSQKEELAKEVAESDLESEKDDDEDKTGVALQE